MSYTKGDYLKSKIDQLRKRSIGVFLIVLIVAITIVIFAVIWTAYMESLGANFAEGSMFLSAFAIIPLLLWIPTRRKLNKARDEYGKFRVEQTENLILEEKTKPRPYKKYASKEKVASIPKENILIFMSYATIDAPTFKIAQIAETLTAYHEIKDVLYWQEHMKDNIIEYMDQNLGKCHAMLLFCSPNAIESIPVKKEWTAAEAINMPIIPVFTSTKYVPPILSSRLGIQFDPFDMEKNLDDIYNTIMKKSS